MQSFYPNIFVINFPDSDHSYSRLSTEQLTPQRVKEIFDPFYKADLRLWTEFAKYLQVPTFKKNEPLIPVRPYPELPIQSK